MPPNIRSSSAARAARSSASLDPCTSLIQSHAGQTRQCWSASAATATPASHMGHTKHRAHLRRGHREHMQYCSPPLASPLPPSPRLSALHHAPVILLCRMQPRHRREAQRAVGGSGAADDGGGGIWQDARAGRAQETPVQAVSPPPRQQQRQAAFRRCHLHGGSRVHRTKTKHARSRRSTGESALQDELVCGKCRRGAQWSAQAVCRTPCRGGSRGSRQACCS